MLKEKVLRYLNRVLSEWAAKNYKRLHRSQRQARRWPQRIFLRDSRLWAHWKVGIGMSTEDEGSTIEGEEPYELRDSHMVS